MIPSVSARPGWGRTGAPLSVAGPPAAAREELVRARAGDEAELEPRRRARRRSRRTRPHAAHERLRPVDRVDDPDALARGGLRAARSPRRRTRRRGSARRAAPDQLLDRDVGLGDHVLRAPCCRRAAADAFEVAAGASAPASRITLVRRVVAVVVVRHRPATATRRRARRSSHRARRARPGCGRRARTCTTRAPPAGPRTARRCSTCRRP